MRARFVAAARAHAAIATSSVAVYELWYGVGKSSRVEHDKGRLETFLGGPIEVVSFTPEDGVIAGGIRAKLERSGTPIGAYDLLIAAQAIRLEAILVTANVSEFRRVDGLQFEDWSKTRR